MYQTLHACGLDAFYRLRDVAGTPARQSNSRFDAFDVPAFARLYIRPASEHLSSVDLVLEGLTCSACVWLIERLPRVVPGVIEARLSLRQATVRIVWDCQKVPLSRIASALNQLGYTPHPAKGVSRSAIHSHELRRRLISLGVAGAIAGNNMLLAFALYAGRFGEMADLYRNFFRWISAGLGVIALVWPGAVFFRGAISAFRVRRLNLDVPISLALLAGGIAGTINVILNRGEIYFDTLSVLVLLLLAGRFLQFRQQRFADDSLELLFSLAPMTCRRVAVDGSIEELPVESLSPGDLIEVRSGDTLAADGTIEVGHSSLCQALLTGESQPAPVRPGDDVFSGAQNQGAALRVRVNSVGQDTRVGRLMKVVEEGTGDKPAIVELADRIGGWFTLVVCAASAITFAFWCRISLPAAIDHCVALLIVTCPCVLGLATPLTIAMAIGQLARRDILVKRGAALETLARRGLCLLDKTGTLTLGSPRLVCWQGDEELKVLVVAMERQSQHPIARVLVEGLEPQTKSAVVPVLKEIEDCGDGGIRATAGKRIVRIGSPAYLARSGCIIDPSLDARRRVLELAGTTVVLLCLDDRVAALAGLGDELRSDSAAAVAALRNRGWREQIISGDAHPIVTSVAQAVGIEPALAQGEMTPEAKLEMVRGCAGMSRW